MRTARLLAATTLTALALTGCGNDDKPAANPEPDDNAIVDGGTGPELGDPVDALKAYAQAKADGDGATVCKHLTAERATDEMGKAGAATCDEAFAEKDESAAADLTGTKNMLVTQQDLSRATIQWRYTDISLRDECDEYVLWGDAGVWQIKYIFEDECDFGE